MRLCGWQNIHAKTQKRKVAAKFIFDRLLNLVPTVTDCVKTFARLLLHGLSLSEYILRRFCVGTRGTCKATVPQQTPDFASDIFETLFLSFFTLVASGIPTRLTLLAYSLPAQVFRIFGEE